MLKVSNHYFFYKWDAEILLTVHWSIDLPFNIVYEIYSVMLERYTVEEGAWFDLSLYSSYLSYWVLWALAIWEGIFALLDPLNLLV